MTPERIAQISDLAKNDYPAFRALSLTEREEWMAATAPRKIYPPTAASRRAVRDRAARRKMLDQLAELRDEDARALSTDADLAR